MSVSPKNRRACRTGREGYRAACKSRTKNQSERDKKRMKTLAAVEQSLARWVMTVQADSSRRVTTTSVQRIVNGARRV
jgi:hypothetical protein